MQFRGIWRYIFAHQTFFDPLWARTDEGFAAVHWRVIEQHRGFCVQMLTALIYPCSHGRRIDGPGDEVRHQRLVAFQTPSDIASLGM